MLDQRVGAPGSIDRRILRNFVNYELTEAEISVAARLSRPEAQDSMSSWPGFAADLALNRPEQVKILLHMPRPQLMAFREALTPFVLQTADRASAPAHRVAVITIRIEDARCPFEPQLPRWQPGEFVLPISFGPRGVRVGPIVGPSDCSACQTAALGQLSDLNEHGDDPESIEFACGAAALLIRAFHAGCVNTTAFSLDESGGSHCHDWPCLSASFRGRPRERLNATTLPRSNS